MTKKIKDLTVEDLKKICETKSGCRYCEHRDLCLNAPYIFTEEFLNKEIEVPEQ